MKSGEQEAPKDRETAEPLGIAERVRFWEEQQRINEILIPKVIRQHELLTRHIKEHGDLHERFRRELAAALEKRSRLLQAGRWLMIVALLCALVSVGSLIGVAIGSGSP